ncbi:MAG TPA: ATP-binding protein [Candidatus Saccharimonadales bacterium]|nr:ATP-binding protein [Candidatus Saccharimonadales bacterium]
MAFFGAMVLLIFAPLMPYLARPHYHLADGSGEYAASNVIGEFNAVGGAFSNFIEPTNQYGMGPNDIVVDTSNHRLFIDDGSNSRILVYNLDNNNNLVSTIPNYVLGEPDLTTETNSFTNQPVTQSSIACSNAMAFDSVNDRLFVADECDSRVLVFDFAGGISNNMNASYVLGQSNFTTGNTDLGNTESDSQTNILDPQALAYDTSSQQLFVADYNGSRLLIFNLSSGISDNMPASNVLGEPDYTTHVNLASPTINGSVTLDPNGVAYDLANKLLYVSDAQSDGIASISGGRVLVYNLSSGITNGMAASHVLGQPNTSGDTHALTQSGMNTPGHLLLDTATDQLFVSDFGNARDTVFDLGGGISDGMNASFVLGEPNFTTANTTDTTINSTTYWEPNGFGYDPGNKRLYLSDNDSRVLTLDLSSGVSNDMAPTSVLGQTDFNGNPTYTSAGFNDKGHFLNEFADQPNGTYVDTVHHLLYVADAGFDRVMVYQLDNNDNLASPPVASYVLGQPDFTTTASTSASQTTITCPSGITGDPNRNLLFVADACSDRVLVYDLSNGISDGMPAKYVIGQTTWTGSGSGDTQTTLNDPYAGIAYDPNTDYLYVGDVSNNRVMVYNTSTGSLSTGMGASYVIGQTNYTNNVTGTSQSTFSSSGSLDGLAIDTQNDELFVADAGSANRVLVFNTAAIGSGMLASHVLGEPNFTSTTSTAGTPPPKANQFIPFGLAYDQVNQRLFVEDEASSRILGFDLSGGITDNANANEVIGQPNLTTYNAMNIPSKYDMDLPYGLTDAYDTTSNQLYVSDQEDGRVLIFGFANLVPINTSPTVGTNYSQVLGDQTQGAVSYSLLSGSPPTGLSFNSGTGQLSGTVTTPGTYSFTVKITDNNGSIGTYTDTHTYNVTVSQSGGGGGGGGTGGGTGGGSGGGTGSGGSGSGGTSTPSGPSKPPTTILTSSPPTTSIPTAPQPKHTKATEQSTVIDLDKQKDFTDGSGYTHTSRMGQATVYQLCLPDNSATSNTCAQSPASSSSETTYSLTVAKISTSGGTSMATISVNPASLNNQTVTFTPGQTRLLDLNNSGHNNVGVEAVNISSSTGAVTLKFWKLASFKAPLPLLTRVANQIVKILPHAIIYAFPYILFVMLGIYTLMVFYQSAKEIREYARLESLLSRARGVNEMKKTFIELASHYLRTPMTLLTGGVDLSKSLGGVDTKIIPVLQAATQDMHTKIEQLLSDAQATSQGPSTFEPSMNKEDIKFSYLIKQRGFMLPLVMLGIIWIAFNYLMSHATTFTVSQVGIALQAIVFAVIILALYQVHRNRFLRRRDTALLKQVVDKEASLGVARDSLINHAVSALKGDLAKIHSAISGNDSPAVKAISNGEQRLQALVDKFIVASRLHGYMSHEPYKQTSFSSVLTGAFRGMKDKVSQKELHFQAPQDMHVDLQEPGLFTYVLNGVIDNAVSYSPEKGTIEVGTSFQSGKLTVSVHDQGDGISKEKLARLFQPFTKSEGAEVFNHEGMGFSLYLDKLILTYLGGDIILDSRTGHGTTVSVSVPTQPAVT